MTKGDSVMYRNLFTTLLSLGRGRRFKDSRFRPGSGYLYEHFIEADERRCFFPGEKWEYGRKRAD